MFHKWKNWKSRKVGGFIFTIPAILAALGAVGSLAGGSGVVAKTVIDAKKKKPELAKQKRHNLAKWKEKVLRSLENEDGD